MLSSWAESLLRHRLRLNGETITNATDGEVQITATTLKLIGTASTSAIKSEMNRPRRLLTAWSLVIVHSGNVNITASTQKDLQAVLLSQRVRYWRMTVFLCKPQARLKPRLSLLPPQQRVLAQFSYASLNTGLGTADGTLGGTSINFWAVR